MKKILIDPGHGGADSGARAVGLMEATVNLAVSLSLADKLSLIGFSPILTRHTNSTVSLPARVALEQRHEPDLFVSVHCNAAENVGASGFEVFTSKGQTAADPAATELSRALKEQFPNIRSREDGEDGDPDREANFYVLQRTRCPAALVELGFLSNDADAARLRMEPHRNLLALALCHGVKNWSEL